MPLDNIAKRAEAYKLKEWVTYKMIKSYITFGRVAFFLEPPLKAK